MTSSLTSSSLWRFRISTGGGVGEGGNIRPQQRRQSRRLNSGYPDNVYRLLEVDPMINIDWDKIQKLVLEQKQCAAAWQESKILHFVVRKDPPLDVFRVLVRELTSDLNRWLMLEVGTGTPLGIACGVFSNRKNQSSTIFGHHVELIRVLLQGLIEWKNNEARPSAYCVPFASIDFSTVSLPILQALLEEYPQGLLQDDTFYRPPQGKGNAKCCFLGEVLLGSTGGAGNRIDDGDTGNSEAIDNDEDEYWNKVELALRAVHDLQGGDCSSEASRPFLHLHALLTALTNKASLVDSNLLEIGQRLVLPELRRRHPKEWATPDADGNFPLHILASAGSKLQAWLEVLLMEENDECDASSPLETCNRKGRLPLHVLLDNIKSSSLPNSQGDSKHIELVLSMLRHLIVKSPHTLVVRDPVTRLYPFQLAVEESASFQSSHSLVVGHGDLSGNDGLILSLNISYELLRQGPQILAYFDVDKSQMDQASYKELCSVDLKMAQLDRTYTMQKQKLQRKRSSLQQEEMNNLLQVD